MEKSLIIDMVKKIQEYILKNYAESVKNKPAALLVCFMLTISHNSYSSNLNHTIDLSWIDNQQKKLLLTGMKKFKEDFNENVHLTVLSVTGRKEKTSVEKLIKYIMKNLDFKPTQIRVSSKKLLSGAKFGSGLDEIFKTSQTLLWFYLSLDPKEQEEFKKKYDERNKDDTEKYKKGLIEKAKKINLKNTSDKKKLSELIDKFRKIDKSLSFDKFLIQHDEFVKTLRKLEPSTKGQTIKVDKEINEIKENFEKISYLQQYNNKLNSVSFDGKELNWLNMQNIIRVDTAQQYYNPPAGCDKVIGGHSGALKRDPDYSQSHITTGQPDFHSERDDEITRSQNPFSASLRGISYTLNNTLNVESFLGDKNNSTFEKHTYNFRGEDLSKPEVRLKQIFEYASGRDKIKKVFNKVRLEGSKGKLSKEIKLLNSFEEKAKNLKLPKDLDLLLKNYNQEKKLIEDISSANSANVSDYDDIEFKNDKLIISKKSSRTELDQHLKEAKKFQQEEKLALEKFSKNIQKRLPTLNSHSFLPPLLNKRLDPSGPPRIISNPNRAKNLKKY